MVGVSLGVSLGMSLGMSFSWEPSIAFRNPEASKFDPMVEEDRFSTLVACCKMSPVDGDALGVETAGVRVRRSG